MGKHFWTRLMDHDEQPCCVWGLVNVLNYHHRHSNVRKKIQHRKCEDDTLLECDWSPGSNMFPSDEFEVESLLDETDNPHLKTKKSRKSRKRSLKSRIKALIAEDKENESKKHKEGFRLKSSLQRTYSIHHLESVDWKHPVIFFPTNVDKLEPNTEKSNEDLAKHESKDETDILEILKVDKDLFIKHLQDANETIDKFAPGMLGLNINAKLSKSRSFPFAEMSNKRKLKPSKLENKQKEVWSFPKEHHVAKNTHQRNFSLKESLDKYARLFEKSYKADTKLGTSKSLKVGNQHGHGSLNFKRAFSVSNADSHYPDINSWVLDDDILENDSSVTETDSSSGPHYSKEEENIIVRLTNETENVPVEFQKDLSDDEIVAFEEFNVSEGLEKKYQLDDLNLINDEKHKNSDSHYVRHLLDQSGITTSSQTWHTSDQPLGPQLFKEFESSWHHERNELTGWPDFNGCWHHMMLFHLVNEVLLEVYDISLPYYPNALSFSCHVRPFPHGAHMVEEVSKKTSKFIDLTLEDKESLDCVVPNDFVNDRSWMNLQFESECTGLEIEDMIFDELLEELLCY